MKLYEEGLNQHLKQKIPSKFPELISIVCSLIRISKTSSNPLSHAINSGESLRKEKEKFRNQFSN